MLMSRRTFLLGAATISAAAATGAALVARPYLAKRLSPVLDTDSPLGILGDEEMRAIVALGETLVAPPHAPPADFFHDYVNRVTRNQHGFLKEYQRVVGLLDATSTRLFGQGVNLRFADLPVPRRDPVLEALLWRYPGSDRVTRKFEKLSASRDALALRMYVMEPLVDYYYRSPYGWAVVGYASFPGWPPLDPRAYARPLEGEGSVS